MPWLDLESPLVDQFAQVAAVHPERPAIADGEVEWTYAELEDRVAWLAGQIPPEPAEEPVAIDLPNGAAFPWAMLACLAVGRPYVPLDRSAPAARNRAILAAAGATFVVHDGQQEVAGNVPGVSVATWPGWAGRKARGKAGLAYILFTSGSSGKPKGVYQTQRSLLHDVRQYLETVRVRPDDRLSLLYSPGVNGAIRDIYGALLAGACLCLRDLRRHGLAGLDDWLEASGVTIYHSIPNVFRTMLAMTRAERFGRVRWVYLAGDRIFTSDAHLFRRFFPGGRLHVGIGATEVATIYRQWVLDGTESLEGEFLPLGFPVPEREMRIVAASGADVGSGAGAGAVGEIWVRSAHVALGYWADPARSAERFIDHGDGTRTYKTGDLGRIRPDGMLELVGRADRQVKIAGTRVEPGEVEAALTARADVVRAAVLPVGEADKRRLIAFVMLAPDCEGTTGASLRSAMVQALPAAFVPAEVRVHEELPLMHNFKTDLAALRAMLDAEAGAMAQLGGTNPGGGDALADAWWSVLGQSMAADPECSWRDAGGDSLMLATLHVRVEAMLEKPLPLGLMTLDLTLQKLRRWVEQFNTFRSPSKTEATILMFPSMWGLSPAARSLIRALHPSHDVQVMAWPPLVGPEERVSLPDAWDRLSRLIDKRFEEVVPDQILANCHGGAIALRWLLDHPDRRLSRLALIDPSLPIARDARYLMGDQWQRQHPLRARFVRQEGPEPMPDRFAGWLMHSAPRHRLHVPAVMLASEHWMQRRSSFAAWSPSGADFPAVALTGEHGDVLGEHNHAAIASALGKGSSEPAAREGL